MDFDVDIVDRLDAQIAALSKGTNLFMGPVRAYSDNVPHKSVFVLRTGGGTVRPLKQDHATLIGRNLEERKATAQIRVRSDLPSEGNAFATAQQLAQDIFDELNFNPDDGYCEWAFVSAGPLYLGMDEARHHEWSMNLQITYDFG